MQGNNRPQSIKSEFISKKGNGLTIPRRTNASLASKKGNTVNKQTLKANKANNEQLKYSNQINDQKKANLPTTKTKSNNYNEKDLNQLIGTFEEKLNINIENLEDLKQVVDAIEHVKNKPFNRRIIFINSWNEWGEGNYLEPDLKFGTKYLEQIPKAVLK